MVGNRYGSVHRGLNRNSQVDTDLQFNNNLNLRKKFQIYVVSIFTFSLPTYESELHIQSIY